MTESTSSIVDEIRHSNISLENINEGKDETKCEHTFEEAIEEAKIGKYQMILIALSGLAMLGSTVENVNISYILPYAKSDLQLNIVQIGVLTSISFLGVVSTSYFWGILADTWGRQKVITTGALCGFILSFISAFVTNTVMLIVLRFFVGAFCAGPQASALAYISEFHNSRTAARAVAFSTMFLSGFAIFMSPLAMIIVPMDWTWQILSLHFRPGSLFLICIASLNLLNGIVFAFLPESPKLLLAINKKEKALQVLRRIYAFNTGQPEQTYPVKSIKFETSGNNLTHTRGFSNIVKRVWLQTKPIFLPPLLTHTLKLCYIIFAIYAIGHGTFMFFPDFLVQLQEYNGSPKTLCSIVEPKPKTDGSSGSQQIDNKNTLSFLIMLVVGFVMVILLLFTTYLMKKISPKKIIYTWLLLSAIASIALNIITEFYSIVTSIVVFLSCGLCANLIFTVALNLFPTSYRGTAVAVVLMFGRLGGFAGSNFVAALLPCACSLIFYIHGGLLISCILLFITVDTNEQISKKPPITEACNE